jgi:hypothetical protein
MALRTFRGGFADFFYELYEFGDGGGRAAEEIIYKTTRLTRSYAREMGEELFEAV